MFVTLSSLLSYFRRRFSSASGSTAGQVGIPLLILVAIGTLGYSWIEGWTLIDALYATIITITTVGYGDLTPDTVGGRLFSIFFTLSAIGLASYAISTLAATIIEKQARRYEQQIRERRMQQIESLNNHIIICGGTIVGHRCANELMQRGESFIFVEENEEQLRWAMLWMNPVYIGKRQRQYRDMEYVNLEEYEQQSIGELAEEIGVLYLLASPTDEQALLRAGIGRAKGLVTAMGDDRDNISIILSARDMQAKLGNDQLRIVSRVNDEMNMRRIYLAGAHKVTSPNFVGGLQMVDHMLSPKVGDLWDQMLFNHGEMFRFGEWHLNENPAWIGRTVDALRAERTQQAIAIHRDGDYLYIPAPEIVLQANDIVIFVGASQ